MANGYTQPVGACQLSRSCSHWLLGLKDMDLPGGHLDIIVICTGVLSFRDVVNHEHRRRNTMGGWSSELFSPTSVVYRFPVGGYAPFLSPCSALTMDAGLMGRSVIRFPVAW